MTEEQMWGKNVLGQLNESREKPHANIIKITLKSGEVLVGQYKAVDFSEKTGEGSILMNNEIIDLRDIHKIE
jgi:hypothetical protein